MAAFLVMVFHMGPFYPAWMRSFETPGYLAVDLFFLLSGVVVARSYGPKLATRIIPTCS
ncbi:MAG: hypothetical protein KGL39_15400 [Patescibacteria group bacterium]|nr:hypothetical protein [Patescibacteria group bacterium]